MPLSELLHTSREELQSELRLILDAVAEGVTGIDRLGNCTFCNDAFLRMTGFAASELIGFNMHALVHHSRRDGSPYPAEECVFLEAVKAGRSIHTIEPVWRKDGTCFFAECWCHPLPGNSEGTAYLVTVLDITEREAAAEALRKSEERFQQISNSIDQVFYLASSDSGRIAYVSPSFDKMFGRGWQMSHQAPELWLEAIIPEHREQILASHKQLVAGNPVQDEYKIVRPDGSTCWIKHHANPIRDGQGKVRQYAGVFEDITESRVAREALRTYVSALEQSEEKYRSLVRNMPGVVWSVDSQRRVAFVSPNVEQFFGHSAEDLYRLGARVWFESIHPDDATKVSQAFEALFAKGEPYDVECRVRRKDGKWIWAHDRSIGTYERDGVRYADGVISDITERKLVEEELRFQTAFLEAQFDSAIDGILVARGPKIVHNQRFPDIFQIPPHLIEPKDIGAFVEHIRSKLKNPKEYSESVTYIRDHPNATYRSEIELKDGTVLDRYTAPVIGKDGENYGRIWTYRDITERKRAEEELRSKSAFLEAIANSTVDGIMVVDGNNQRILENQQLTKMLKVPQDILDEKSVLPMRQHVAARTKNPEELLAKIANLQQHPQEISWDEIEFKDGTILDTYSAPAIGKDSKHYGRIWTFRDITERRRDEEVLRQLSLAVEQSPVSIMITDPQARITYVNPRFIEWTGYSRGEVMGRNPRFLKSGHTSPEEYKKLWRTIAGGSAWRGEFCNRKKNGELYWESVAITPIKDAKGAITHFLGIKEDITERRAMENQLRQAQKLEAIGQLAAGIAHEINTPTQFASDNLSFLRDSWGSLHGVLSVYRTVLADGIQNGFSPQSWSRIHQAERDEDLDFVAAEIPRAIEQALDGMQRVAKIVRAMKEFSHSDSGDKEPVDINKAIETTITVARNEWKYVAEVETRFDPGLPLVPCHVGELNQVVLNLIVNAAHAIKDKIKDEQKGLITVRTCAKGEFAEIAVTDTGVGIPEAIRSRVFDPFFTTKEVGKGTGQGLSLAHSSIVKKHGGKIWFETEVGRGTTFFVHLPIHGAGGEGKP